MNDHTRVQTSATQIGKNQGSQVFSLRLDTSLQTLPRLSGKSTSFRFTSQYSAKPRIRLQLKDPHEHGFRPDSPELRSSHFSLLPAEDEPMAKLSGTNQMIHHSELLLKRPISLAEPQTHKQRARGRLVLS